MVNPSVFYQKHDEQRSIYLVVTLDQPIERHSRSMSQHLCLAQNFRDIAVQFVALLNDS